MLKSLLFLSIAAISCQAGILPVLPGSHVPIDVAKPQDPLSTANSSKPWFCHDLDCPKFTVVETNSKFELRRYEPSVWVATTLTRMLYTDDDNRLMFFKLFSYISGNNSAGMKIPMTAPVVNQIEHGQGPDCESNFTMHFMIPLDMYANPPTPLDKTVFIRRIDESMALVKSYGGFSTDEIKRQQLEEFIQDLDAAGKKYADNVFFTAGYDGPYTFNKRHNELWVSPL